MVVGRLQLVFILAGGKKNILGLRKYYRKLAVGFHIGWSKENDV